MQKTSKELEITTKSNGSAITIRELSLIIDALKEGDIERDKLYNERDRRYEERFTAQDKAMIAALAAVEKQTVAAALASEKAIDKQEMAQNTYNVGHNDLSHKMEAQYKEMVLRSEYLQGHQALIERVDEKSESLEKEMNTLKGFISGKVANDEYRPEMKRIDERIIALETSKAVVDSKASQISVIWSYVFTGIAILIAIVSLVMKILGK